MPCRPVIALSRSPTVLRDGLCPGLLAAVWLLSGQAAGAAEAAHQHGAAQLELVIGQRSLSLTLDAPQHSLLGHEQAPRTPAQQQAAAALLARLRDGASLWALPPGLKCVLRSAEVVAPLLQAPAAAGGGKALAAPDAQADSHADVQAHWQFDCARVDGLRQLDIGRLLDAFAGLQRLQAQVVSPSGQYQANASRPQRLLAWGR